VGQDKGSLAEQ